MLEQIKLGLKLVKYGLSFKMQIALAILFCLFGLITEYVSRSSNLLGGFYILISAMFVIQLVISMDISLLVQTSPYKKKLQTSMPVLACVPIMLGAYTVEVLIKGYFLYFHPEISADAGQQASIKGGLEGVIVLLFVTAIYMGFCFKYFAAAMIGLFVVVLPISIVFQMPFLVNFIGQLPFGWIVLAGYILIPLGEFLAYQLSRLLYKKDLSRYAFGASLKRAEK